MRTFAEGRRRKDPAFWHAINRVLFALVSVGAITIVALWFYPELARRDEMLRHLEREKQVLADQQLLFKQREREVFLLENDREYVETIARDRLDMMKDGEVIFRIDPARTVRAKSN